MDNGSTNFSYFIFNGLEKIIEMSTSGAAGGYTDEDLGPVYSPFFGVIGASAAMIFTGKSIF